MALKIDNIYPNTKINMLICRYVILNELSLFINLSIIIITTIIDAIINGLVYSNSKINLYRLSALQRAPIIL